MPAKRRTGFRMLQAVAVGITALFLLSIIFQFGASTHHDPPLGWTSSYPGVGILQVYCSRGQFHLLADIGPRSGQRAQAERTYYAGAAFSPNLSFDLHKTDRFISKLGLDAFALRGGTYLSCGTVGLYPAILAWAFVWLAARLQRRGVGLCPQCGYNVRGALGRCPECGAVQSGRARQRAC